MRALDLSAFVTSVPDAVLVDSNLFLLLLVGTYDPKRIEHVRRTQKYTVRDFYLARAVVAKFTTTVTTPNVLAEVSNLARQTSGRLGDELMRRLADSASRAREDLVRSGSAMARQEFVRLGLTDCAVMEAAGAEDDVLVFTDDLPLYVTASRLGLQAINFAYLQEADWALTDGDDA